ncbi:MAG: methyltransferase domain-containing protein [Gammaproteobacteria bacterium]|nr:methyltransferase domain-containing protein [Gammaproteobacteria bacterium]
MKKILQSLFYKIQIYSLVRASKQQGMESLVQELITIIPNISDQYVTFKIDSDYLERKVRNLHAFQIGLITDAVKKLQETKDKLILVDIGDSSGNHLIYLNKLLDGIEASSVNLDEEAIKRIQSKGLKAIKSRAEELHQSSDFNQSADIFFSFEMLEHLESPTSFLTDMAEKSECEIFIITVPMVIKSRVGLHQIRNLKDKRPLNPENTHIFEFSPDDWDLLFKFSGWKITKRVKYFQYPRKSLLSPLKFLWRRMDFDGFYGVILEKDDTFSKRRSN